MKLRKKNKLDNRGWGLDSLIGFLVLFGVAILIVVIMVFFNKIV